MKSLNDDLAGKVAHASRINLTNMYLQNAKPQEKSSADGKNMFKRVFNSFRSKPKAEGVPDLARENRALQYKVSRYILL